MVKPVYPWPQLATADTILPPGLLQRGSPDMDGVPGVTQVSVDFLAQVGAAMPR